MSSVTVSEFQDTVWDFYAKNARDFPWRRPDASGNFDLYRILVSEVMLQQTQVNRVVPKYLDFLQRFPTSDVLASAPLSDVLTMWNGLGYNRRAKYLWQAAGQLRAEQQTVESLSALPGIGKNTAGAILAYAYNTPTVFIETNIRTVFIHYFFPNKTEVSDADLLPIINEALDTEHPREWYWALMDLGTHIKANHGNVARQSKHHIRQSVFEGSRRQVRGRILKELIAGSQPMDALSVLVSDERFGEVLKDLTKEGLVTIQDDIVTLGT